MTNEAGNAYTYANNVELVYNLAEHGKLSDIRADGTPQLNALALEVLLLMATFTYSPCDPQLPADAIPRCYTAGWRFISSRLGWLHIPDALDGKPLTEEEKCLYLGRREGTARVRVSKAWTWLQKHKLLAKVRNAGAGENAVFVLMIGDDEENQRLLRLAGRQEQNRKEKS